MQNTNAPCPPSSACPAETNGDVSMVVHVVDAILRDRKIFIGNEAALVPCLHACMHVLQIPEMR